MTNVVSSVMPLSPHKRSSEGRRGSNFLLFERDNPPTPPRCLAPVASWAGVNSSRALPEDTVPRKCTCPHEHSVLLYIAVVQWGPIFTMQYGKAEGSSRRGDRPTRDRVNRPTKGSDDRYTLNIFRALAHLCEVLDDR